MYGLSEKNIKELTSILASFPHIEEAIIYGSRAKGNYRSGSDVDLSLKGAELTYRATERYSIGASLPQRADKEQ